MENASHRFLLITFITKRPLIFVLFPLLLISYLFGWFHQNTRFDMNLFIPGDSTQTIQFLEGIILVIIAILSGVLIVIAIKKRFEKILKIFFATGFFISSVGVFWFHGFLINISYSNPIPESPSLYTFVKWIELITTLIGFIVGFLSFVVFILNKGTMIMKNSVVFVLGIAIGSLFGLILHTATFFTFLVLISIFDIYSVYKGPISKIFNETNLSITPQNHPSQERTVGIGIGDFVFYSALVTFISSNYGLILGACSIIGIVVGIKITEKMLHRYNKFPGLPIPIFFSLFLFGMGWIILNILLGVGN